MKSENYFNLGGINEKVSPYNTGPTEYLNIINFDFQTITAHTQRWGSTQYTSQNFGAPISSLVEFSRLDGTSFVVVGCSGALWSGATTGLSQGLSLTSFGITAVSSFFFNDLVPRANGIVGINSGFPLYYNGNRQMAINSNFDGSGTSPATFYINSENLSTNKLSYTVLQNNLFFADGNVFGKYDGITTSFIGLPPVTQGAGITIFWSSGATITGLYIQDSYGIGFYASYVNRRGFEGPIWPMDTITMSSFSGVTAASLGGTIAQIKVPIFVPPEYDIASINLYSYAGMSLSLLNAVGSTNFWNLPYVFLSNTAITAGNTFTYVTFGTGQGRGQSNIIGNIGSFPQTPNYVPIGLTFVVGQGVTQGVVTQIDMINYSPQYLEVYSNRLFLAGFSATPSTVWFSDTGEPEGYQSDWNFEIRTNDADYITAMKSYFSYLYLFKQNSFHILTGDSPNNFFLQEVSNVYGCLNNRCVVVYDNFLAFLDRKGVVIYNGASPSLLSSKVQATFDSMNYTVAINTACMVHDKLRSQIMIAIPINGSLNNNVTLVYDYLVNAWTKYDGYSPTVFASIIGRNNTKNAFYGTSAGIVNWFGPSFLSDNGAGFTTYFKTRFLHDLGESYQKQFRRLYLNVDPPLQQMTFIVNFFQDFGSSIVGSSIIGATAFQTRIDYGISAKSLAFEFSSIQTNQVLKLHGYTIESRLQRKV